MDQKFYVLVFGRPYLHVSAQSQDGGGPWRWTSWYSKAVKDCKTRSLMLVIGGRPVLSSRACRM
jgi:hypothetical protein